MSHGGSCEAVPIAPHDRVDPAIEAGIPFVMELDGRVAGRGG